MDSPEHRGRLRRWALGMGLALPLALSGLAPIGQRAVLAQDACLVASPAPTPSPEPLLMPDDSRLKLFETVWGAIDEAYLDPTFNGTDWGAIGDAYAPLFLHEEDAWRVYDLATEMVDELHDDGVRFVNPLIVEGIRPEPPDYVGIGVLVSPTVEDDGSTASHIMYLFPGSAGIDAGLRVRDRIVSVDGDPCVSVERIRGPEGTSVTIGIQSPGEAAREVTLERRRIELVITPISATMGADGATGYLRLPSMDGQVTLDGVTEALTDLRTRDIRALILDLRSVSLGSLGVTAGILAHLLDGDAGGLYSRKGTIPMELPESDLLADLRSVPIAVLVDQDSYGEPERLAAILQATGRATVIGQATEGGTRVTQAVAPGDGSVLVLPTLGLELPDGTRLGRQGITPDIPITEDWLDFPESEDPYLLAAFDRFGADAAPTTMDSQRP